MEVHAHPRTEQKRLKHYLFEFFMLFLAVFCGFLAENFREHQVESEKEKEYIHSLLADLQNDQQALSKHIVHVNAGILMMDTLINLLNNPTEAVKNSGQLYYLARLAPRLAPLPINTRTFEQLKNSGNFRLVKNLATSDKIMAYYEKLSLVHLLESINETEFTEFKKVAAKIFDPSTFLKMEGANDAINRTTENPPLRSKDAELLQELSIFAVYMHGTKKGIKTAVEDIRNAGKELLQFLQNKYH